MSFCFSALAILFMSKVLKKINNITFSNIQIKLRYFLKYSRNLYIGTEERLKNLTKKYDNKCVTYWLSVIITRKKLILWIL